MSEQKAPADSCVLVTGGAGFIGSHTVVELLERGYRVVVVDDLSNASEKVLDRIGKITKEKAAARLSFYQADVSDRAALEAVFAANDIDYVIHFAGFKAVGESVLKPVEYYSNNLNTTLTLVDVMAAGPSSSAAPPPSMVTPTPCPSRRRAPRSLQPTPTAGPSG